MRYPLKSQMPVSPGHFQEQEVDTSQKKETCQHCFILTRVFMSNQENYMHILENKNSLIAKLSSKCLPTINPILSMRKQKQRSPMTSPKLRGLEVLPLCYLCYSPVNHIHAILYSASLLSNQCFNPPCHKPSQDIGERREDGRWG